VKSGHGLGSPFGVDGLVEIDPEHAGKERDRGRERQEQHDCPDGVFRDPPSSHPPQQRREERDDHERQGVTDVHRSQKVAGFALKLEIADRTALVHLGKSPEDGVAKDISHTAAGTALAKNIAHHRQLRGSRHHPSTSRDSNLTDGGVALSTPTFVTVDAQGDSVLICDYTGKEVVE